VTATSCGYNLETALETFVRFIVMVLDEDQLKSIFLMGQYF